MNLLVTRSTLRALVLCAVSAAQSAHAAGPAPASAPIPDLSGIWSHLTFPDAEPPLSGAGPVTNRSRVTPAQAASLAPYNGGTGSATSPNGISNLSELVGDYTSPILKPAAADIVKRHGEISLKGIAYPTPSNQCWPGGVPFVFWNIGMQMVQEKDKVTFIYSNGNEVRHVRLNAVHPARVTPSWFGDSVGHYEGDTLVIDTVGMKVGPFAMVDMYGTPHTEALHVVERYRLLDYEAANESEERGERENFRIQLSDTGFARNPEYRGPGLLLEYTVDDPGVFTTPWSAMITYRRPLGTWPEFICADGTRDYVGREISLPHTDKPDF